MATPGDKVTSPMTDPADTDMAQVEEKLRKTALASMPARSLGPDTGTSEHAKKPRLSNSSATKKVEAAASASTPPPADWVGGYIRRMNSDFVKNVGNLSLRIRDENSNPPPYGQKFSRKFKGLFWYHPEG